MAARCQTHARSSASTACPLQTPTTCLLRRSDSRTPANIVSKSRPAKARTPCVPSSRKPPPAACRSTASVRAAASCSRPTTRSARCSRSAVSTASRSACSSARAPIGTRASRRRARPGRVIGSSLRGADQLAYGIEDVLHGAALGLRSILVADLGQLKILGEMKRTGDLPPDFVLKVSVTLAAPNPATARLSRISAPRRSTCPSICRCRRSPPSARPSTRRSTSMSKAPTTSAASCVTTRQPRWSALPRRFI